MNRAITPSLDFADVVGHTHAKRALLIAATGGHRTLLIGSPGSGRTMLARRLTTILPPLTDEESAELVRIYRPNPDGSGRCGMGMPAGRPLRAPHHTTGRYGISGLKERPGEVQLASHGVLFLDEVTEFRPEALESVRRKSSYLLVAAAHPCHCGYYLSGVRECRCPDDYIALHQRRLHVIVRTLGILLTVRVQALDVQGLQGRYVDEEALTSDELRARLMTARAFGQSAPPLQQRLAPEVAHRALRDGVLVSARISVAETIADLDGSVLIEVRHLDEALAYC